MSQLAIVLDADLTDQETGYPAYLCGKPGEKPRWVDDEVQAAVYEASPLPSAEGNGGV